MTVAVYAALSIQSYLFFLGKSHFGNIYFYNKLYNKVIAYVTRKNNPPDFGHIDRVNTAPSLKLTNEKIRPFARGPQNETLKFI